MLKFIFSKIFQKILTHSLQESEFFLISQIFHCECCHHNPFRFLDFQFNLGLETSLIVVTKLVEVFKFRECTESRKIYVIKPDLVAYCSRSRECFKSKISKPRIHCTKKESEKVLQGDISTPAAGRL